MELIVEGGLKVLISDEDYPLVEGRRLSINMTGYVMLGGKKLHRAIAKPAKSISVHHKNGNKLDNRRENLEIMTSKKHRRVHHNKFQSEYWQWARKTLRNPQLGACRESFRLYWEQKESR